MTFDAFIFDMDGLLVDSEPVWEQTEIDLLKRYGKTHDPNRREQVVGLRMDEFMMKMDEFYQFESPQEQLIDELITHMCELVPTDVVARDGVKEIFAYVVENNIPRAIASSSPLRVIQAVIQSQGWEDIIQLAVSADSVERGKPAPDVYLETARQLGVKPERCLAFEDSPNGARAAVAAGMTCYAIPDLSHTQPSVLADITPHVFSNLHEALDHISRLTVR